MIFLFLKFILNIDRGDTNYKVIDHIHSGGNGTKQVEKRCCTLKFS